MILRFILHIMSKFQTKICIPYKVMRKIRRHMFSYEKKIDDPSPLKSYNFFKHGSKSNIKIDTRPE